MRCSLFLTAATAALSALLLFAGVVNAQSESLSLSQSLVVSAIPTSTPFTTSARRTVSAGRTVSVTDVLYTPTTVMTTSTATVTTTVTPTPDLSVDASIDPTFGVLGGLLILTGLPSAFWGHKNRWSSFFIVGFYAFALACISLILHFGVEQSIYPPTPLLRGLFLLSCAVAGTAGGVIAIFFHHQFKFFIGALGGFLVGLWIQCFRDGGLIQPLGFRWILYIGCAVLGFVLCTISKIHYMVLIAGTAFVGASAFMLGIDCYTTVGLKEFYIYNLGFSALFPKFWEHPFPVTQLMQIELGMIAAVALMGAAVQLRLDVSLQRRLREIRDEQAQRDREMEEAGGLRAERLAREREVWEKDHGPLAPPPPPGTDSATLTPGSGRASAQFFGHKKQPSDPSPPPAEPEQPPAPMSQTELPPLDLGRGVEESIPTTFVAPDRPQSRQELLTEIDTIRKSIDALRSETTPTTALHRLSTYSLDAGALLASAPPPTHLRPPRAEAPRPRVKSMDALGSVPTPAARGAATGSGSTPTPTSSGTRTNATTGLSIARPLSTPLQGDDWDQYVRERKLFTPPQGVTPPIVPTPPQPPAPAPVASPAPKRPLPGAVLDALMLRRRRESALELGHETSYPPPQPPTQPMRQGRRHSSTLAHIAAAASAQVDDDPDDVPLSQTKAAAPGTSGHRKSFSVLPMILPRRRQPSPPTTQAPVSPAPRTATFEELSERHREKLRALQAPLSLREQEQAALDAAKSRWERSKTVEREVMTKREAEKAAAAFKEAERRLAEQQRKNKGKGKEDPRHQQSHQHGRSASAGALIDNAAAGPAKRMSSAAKVQEWQRHQQRYSSEDERGPAGASPRDRRQSSSGVAAVPFPSAPAPRQPRSRGPRDPAS